MTPEDWRRGIENEAEHVADRSWASEARRTATLIILPRDLSQLALLCGYSLLVTGLVLLLSSGVAQLRDTARTAAQEEQQMMALIQPRDLVAYTDYPVYHLP